jgi:hypothetical protein
MGTVAASADQLIGSSQCGSYAAPPRPKSPHDRRRHRDDDDAQVLHDRDQAHVAAERRSEQHHHGGRTWK